MRIRSGISRFIVLGMLVTLVFPFSTTIASASNNTGLVMDTQIPKSVEEMTSVPLQSDQDVLAYLESTLITNNSTKRGIVQSDSKSLSFIKKNRDQHGKDHYLYQKTVNGVPVYGQYARIHLNTDRTVQLVQNGLLDELNVNIRTTPSISSDIAIHNVVSEVELEIGQVIDFSATIGPVKTPSPTATLMIYPLADKYVLAYEIELNYIKPTMGAWVAYVDAITGSVIKRYSTIEEARTLSATQAADGSGLDSKGDIKPLNLYFDNDGDLTVGGAVYLLMDVTKPMFDTYSEDNNVIFTADYTAESYDEASFPTSTINDPDAVDAHYNAGLVYDFYYDNYNWDGITGVGGSIISLVNYEEEFGEPYDNAYWSGLTMVYGDGSGASGGLFNCLACAKDIVAHELTHAVDQHSANLVYEGQSGALSESMADIMAVVFDNDDWTIAEDTMLGGDVLRSLANPGATEVLEKQPSHMSQYVIKTDPNDPYYDHGGVHTNSGIPNHAAYLMATGLDVMFDDSSNTTLNALDGRTILGELTFSILTNYLVPTSDFLDARNSYMYAAHDYLMQVDWTNNQKREFMYIIWNAWSDTGIGEPMQEPTLTYSANGFTETSNNGSIANSIIVTLDTDMFTGANSSDYIADNKVTVSNVPAGLTAVVHKLTDKTVVISLSGSASSHAVANNTTILIKFADTAFTYFYDFQVANLEKNLSINFTDSNTENIDPPLGPPVIAPPSLTPPVTPPVDVPVIVEGKDGPVFVPSKQDTTTATDANGNKVVEVTLSAASIDQLTAQLKKDNSQQQVTINIEDAGDLIQLQISAAGLLEFAASAPNAVINVKSGTSSYQLPVGLLDLEAIAAELNSSTGNLNIQVKMEKINGEVKSSFLKSVSVTGGKLLGDAIDFSIIAQSNGSSKEIKDFGKTYVSRTMTLDGNISPKNASVVVFNPTTSRLSFVPATFKVTDGNTEVTIKRNSNSIYAVVETKKIFFADVQKHWAAADIDYLASRLIISGFDESTFKPNDAITRAQFTTMLVQALGLSQDEMASFSDIPVNAWYKGNVGAAVKAGITSGIDTHSFKPDALITREQMAVMVANALTFVGNQSNKQEAILLEPFMDRSKISSWARASVAASLEAGIISGMDKETFAPLQNATRAQAAVMIRGLLTTAKFVN